MADRGTLWSLVLCLRGNPPPDCDWQAVIETANRTLITGTLACRLLGHDAASALPEDVRSFLSTIHERTTMRNARMLAQLEEGVACLNGEGMQPILLKGAARLASQATDGAEGRLLSDLDLMVSASAMPRAIACLERIGYRRQSIDTAPESAAVLYRETDVGMIDLHCRAKAVRPGIRHDDIVEECAPITLGDGVALMPSPTVQALILVLHDQLQDRDYWRGLIDMRHLIDLDALAKNPPGIDWVRLSEYFPDGYPLRALQVQALTASRLFATPVPDAVMAGAWPRFQYWRRMVQARWPTLMTPMTYLTLALDPLRWNAPAPVPGEAGKGKAKGGGKGRLARVSGALRRLVRQRASGKA